MFRKTRRKIILAIMGSLVLLFAITLSVILFASYREVNRNNAEKLERYMDLYRLGQDEMMEPASGKNSDRSEGQTRLENNGETTRETLPDSPPWSKNSTPPPEERSDYQLSTFYAVAFSKDGEILRIDDDEKGLYSEEDLAEIARGILDNGTGSGKTGSLLFRVSSRPGYTLVAFLDITITESNLGILLRNVLIAGGIAFVLLFFVALFISKRIVRPLEENDRKQKQFISDASHELKTPISVIGANAEMLSRETGKSEWLDNILYENERMGTLVKQLLDLSRAESSELPKEDIDLSRIVSGEILVFESLAFDQGKTLQSKVEEDIMISGNRSQIQQLVSILLDNAMRHSSGADISISLRRQSHSAVLSVENDGESIPEEKLKHLFDRFYRIDEARNSEDNHYGLGLSIAKAVAERHKGNIWVSCQGGKVRFSVSLPL